VGRAARRLQGCGREIAKDGNVFVLGEGKPLTELNLRNSAGSHDDRPLFGAIRPENDACSEGAILKSV
jgi:hypothetical protein